MIEWSLKKFGECAELVRETVSPSEMPADTPYIGLEHIGESALALIGTGVSSDVSSAKSKFEKGDVLFGKLRPYFRKVVRPKFSGVCSTDIWVVRPEQGIDAGYLFYWMASQDFVDAATQASEGTKMPRASWEFVSKFEQYVPPLPEQRAIAEVLGALDDKIELNRRMNETLEQLARAVFKSWFVDFDPVQAKAAGRAPAGMDAITAALFPSAFEGDVPQGWRVEEIGNAVKVVGGSTPSTKNPDYWDGEHHWATPKDLSVLQSPVLLDTERKITQAGVSQISSGILPAGVLLMSSRAPVGYLAISEIPISINQGFIAMICDGDLPNYYVLHWAQTNMEAIQGRANGTTFMEISKSNFRPMPVIVPSKPVLEKFTAQVEPLYKKIVANLQESRTLAALRDALLPGLMRGEVRVEVGR